MKAGSKENINNFSNVSRFCGHAHFMVLLGKGEIKGKLFKMEECEWLGRIRYKGGKHEVKRMAIHGQVTTSSAGIQVTTVLPFVQSCFTLPPRLRRPSSTALNIRRYRNFLFLNGSSFVQITCKYKQNKVEESPSRRMSLH